MKHGTLTMVAMAGTVAIAGAAQAAECPEGFPSGPINLQVGFGAGGGTDAIARSIATAMKEQQDWTIVVENQPGAGGGVTATSLMNADPDGQAIGVAETDTVAIGPYLGDDAQFAWQDFDYLGSAMQLRPVTLPDAPYDNLAEFAEYARRSRAWPRSPSAAPARRSWSSSWPSTTTPRSSPYRARAQPTRCKARWAAIRRDDPAALIDKRADFPPTSRHWSSRRRTR